MVKFKFVFFLVLFAYFFSYSQTRNLTGIISDTLNKPLENANIIASPFDKNEQLKFAIADNKGRYKLELEHKVKYEVTASYIGYIEQIFIIEPNSTISTHNFKLKSSNQQLKEIVIKHEYKPVVIKKDTMTFNVKSFANGNERKMKEVLEKLPGVEVDKKGNVTVQGKKVTQMLVEGKSFFGGGSKLAVENIPADALDKIEVIDHFNQVGFMKKVSDSDELAMNVKLKKEKKKFVFGDVQAGAEIANNNGYYLGHTGLFYYSPNTNVSFIGDINNIGKSTFTFEDLIRFEGGVSNFLNGRKSMSNLFAFSTDNTDVVRNKSQFGATNFSIDVSKKVAVSGYGIVSKSLLENFSQTRNTYLQNTLSTTEDKTQTGINKSFLGIGNIKLDYTPSKLSRLFYNAQFQFNNTDINSVINSISNNQNSLFESLNKSENQNFKQFIEWHKSYNENHTTTFVVNNSFEKLNPQTFWNTNQPFLSGLIPVFSDANYRIQQIKNVTNKTIDVLFKHYWILNNFNHLYTILGNNNGVSTMLSNEKQLLSNGNINDFSNNGFGNNNKYQLKDSYFAFEYKFKIGKWTNKPGIYFHHYNLSNVQFGVNNTIKKNIIQPQWNSDYEFNQSEKINFNYNYGINFPDLSQTSSRFSLQSYNTVFKGNALLSNERFHNVSLRYSKMNMFRGITINSNFSYNKKVNTIRNQIELSGINQFTTPVLTNNPEENIRFSGSFSKRVYRFNLKLNTNLNWFNYFQVVNNVPNLNNRNNQLIGLSIKTAYKKWPDFSIGYNKNFNQLKGITTSSFYTDALNSRCEITFLKDFVFEAEYENFKNTNSLNQRNYYEILNASLRYHKKNSPLTFEITANNLLNINSKQNNSFSDFLISEQATFILPRIIMISLSYKL